MAWTHAITGKALENGVLVVNVEYTDGKGGKVQGVHRPQDLDNLKAIVTEKLAALTLADTLIATLPPSLDLTPVTPPPPPAPDVASEAYVKKLIDLKGMQNAIALGAKKDTDADYVALRDAVKTDYKPEYLPLIGQFG